jgi:hypothetical protein
VTGFFEESPGVRSMARLTIFSLGLQTAAIVATICTYVLRGKAEQGVVAALAGVLAALVANGIVAIVKRGTGE